MTHYSVHTILLCLLIAACNSVSKLEGEQLDPPPNLVLVLVDDLGYGDVGFHGCTDIPTPNIDRIAKEGVTFTNGYVSWAACGPSRAGLITGRYQDRFGFSRNPLFAPNDPNMGLPLSEQSLADALGQAGYRSAAIGKWHLGAHPAQRPLQRGFDDFFGFLTGGHRYFPEEWTLADEYEVSSQYEAYRTKLLRNDQRIEEEEYLTDALSREAVNYIEKYKDNPFFIYLAYNAPHSPMQATEKYLQRFSHIENNRRRTYAAMVSAVDDGVGKILEKLEELKLEEHTLVVFLSDNGGPEHVNASDNGPLRGKKGDLWEGGIRVPFAMRWPGEIPSGIAYEEPIISLDIFATMVAQSPQNIRLKNPLDGVNLLPYLKAEKRGAPHERLFWRKFNRKQIAVREGAEKMIHSPTQTELYHLTKDIGEQRDLSTERTGRITELDQYREAWLSEMIDPLFLGLSQDSIYNTRHPDRFDRPDSPADAYLTRDGAWCWFSDPRAIFNGEELITGWVKTDGTVETASFRPESGELKTRVLYPQLQPDDHNNPAFALTATGEVVVAYTTHSGKDGFFVHRTAQGGDVMSFGEPEQIFVLDSTELMQFPKVHVTYANPYRLEAENDRIYCFGRWTGYKPNMMWSDDGGLSWTKSKVFITNHPFDPNNRPYVKYHSDGQSKIHIIFTDGHPRVEPTNSVYYACYEQGAFYQADGSMITDMQNIPFEPRNASVIYQSNEKEGRAWIADVAQDENGRPVVLYTRSPSESDHRYWYARYDGKNWIQSEICKAGTWFPQTQEGKTEREPHYFGNMSLHPVNPNVIYLSRQVDGVFEIERRETNDMGKSWKVQPITQNSRFDNVRPYVPRGSKAEQEIVLWMENRRYVHYTDYQSAIRYHVWEK